MSNEIRLALEQQLLRAPFDVALRRRHVRLLLDMEDVDAALEHAQLLAELLRQQRAEDGEGAVLLARALHASGRTAEAIECYQSARLLGGFEPEPTLEALAASMQREATPRLRLIDADADAGTAAAKANVRAIQSVPEDKVRFSSIVGMEALKKTIRIKIIEPYMNPGLFERFRMRSGGGILLYGPPGCGKTMLARAVANECKATFVPVGISDVLNMYRGESERNLAAMFEKARVEAPSVLFFDELDALAYSRSKSNNEGARTIVNEFLSQLDGIGNSNRGVLVLSATNMPWDVDGAMKRPGRFSRQIFVPPPDLDARAEMLRLKLLGVPTDALDLHAVARRAEYYSGADIDGLIELAKESALEDAMSGNERGLSAADFDAALAQMQPSTLEWLRTVRNVVKYAGDGSYGDVEAYLKQVRML